MHAPPDYDCPFCKIVSGKYDQIASEPVDVVMQNDTITAFVASHQWPNNQGHVLIVPNEHFENLYSLPPRFAEPIHDATQRIAVALKSAFGCTGTSTRQHNEPDGGQDVWHYHVHVFPRYEGDNLYGSKRQRAEPENREKQAAMIREALSQVGV